MFQYVFGQYLVHKYHCDVWYDVKIIGGGKSFTNRSLDLCFFYPKNFNYSITNLSLKWRIIRKMVSIFPFLNKKLIVQTNPHQFIDYIPEAYYDGYWQNYEYLESIRISILDEFKPLEEDLNKHQCILDSIKSCNSVSIHIRRGDYINISSNAKIFHICDKEYYYKGVNYFRQNVVNPLFFIFSEDIEWCKKNFVGEEFIFMDINSPHIDMYLMSMCKHNIISNSTFGWWAAMLNKNIQKTVIAPKKWYVNYFQNKLNDFLPENWIKL